MIRCERKQSGFKFLVVAVLGLALLSTVARADCIGSSDLKNWSPCGSDSGSAPSRGGGYVAPAPSGPSPAQIAAQRQRAAALAANNRGIVARKRGDFVTAVREFELAARLAPNDPNIRSNYNWGVSEVAKAMSHVERTQAEIGPLELKAKQTENAQDWDKAVVNFQAVDDLCVRQNHGQRCDGAELALHRVRGRRAAASGDWDTAIEELRAAQAIYQDYVAKKLDDVFSKAEKPLQYLNAALVDKARQEEAEHKADLQRQQEQASNPNYPKPPPVYRDAKTPRDYPDLTSYTPAQHSAHADNETGNLYAQKGDWVQALLSYQKALTEDSDGAFSQVLKDNLAIAMQHLGSDGVKNTSGATAASQPVPQKQTEEKPRQVAESNCTGWTTQSDGASFRLCTDDRGQRYCEQADNKGVASRVSCQ